MTVADARAAPARACAYRVIRRVFEHGAYADRALAAEARAAGLDQRDRALAMRLAYGAVQRRATLDHLAERLARRPLRRLDAAVRAALELGLLQVLFLDGVPAHAAVNESVALARAAGSHGGSLVNAVLRRAAHEGRALLDELDDSDPARAAILHSVPEWLAAEWWAQLGAGEARALLRAVNEPAESALRVNTLVASVEEVAGRLPVPTHPATDPSDPDRVIPEGLVLEGPVDVQGSALWRCGAVMPQSRASMLAVRMLAPRPGDRVLDLCAAPGAKTTHIAALLGNDGEVVALERNRGRARSLTETCARMGASCVRVLPADARQASGEGAFDRVLLDPPCSGLGTLQSRPDIRWRASPAKIAELAALQAQLLRAAAAATAPGGVLVYSVCTISDREGRGVVERFIGERPEFAAERTVQTLPHRDRTDGFYLARLRRSAG